MRITIVALALLLTACSGAPEDRRHFKVTLANKKVLDICGTEYRMYNRKEGWQYVILRYLPGVGYDHAFEAPAEMVDTIVRVDDKYCEVPR